LGVFEHGQTHRQQATVLACVWVFLSMDKHTGNNLLLWRVCLRVFDHGQTHRQPASALACVCVFLTMDKHTDNKLVLWRVFACF
jgi:hypothetical protein